MQPNILLFTSHDLGKHLALYGRETVDSPSLNELARSGVVFENSFCTAPQCSPSRAVLHTGRHAHTVGMLGLAHSPFGWRLHSNDMHLAHTLLANGYATALIGVQHLTRSSEVAELGYTSFDADNPVRPAQELAADAALFLHQARQNPQPFYLEVGFFEPHRPFDWGEAVPDQSLGVRVPNYLPDTPEARTEFAALQGAIHQMDAAVGEILNTLEQEGLAENTWVIFTTDHGLAMPRAKCTLYDPGIETALLMRWPVAGISGGRRFPHLISHVDLVPTILDALQITSTQPMHGRSYWPLLRNEPYTPNEAIFAEKTFHTAYEPMRAIRTERYKLIVNLEINTRVNVPDDVRQSLIYPGLASELTGQPPPIELYDLATDPGETVNLSGQAGYAATEQALIARLLDWMQQTEDPLLKGPVMSPYYAAAMEALGQHPQTRTP